MCCSDLILVYFTPHDLGHGHVAHLATPLKRLHVGSHALSAEGEIPTW